MFIYLIVFVLSAIFFNKASERKSHYSIWSLIAIVLPSLLAALRDISIGTDTVIYADLYETCINSPYSLSLNVEFSFYIISKIAYWLFGFPTVLFIYEFFSIICIYLIAYKYKSSAPVFVVMLMYFFLFYNMSFNITRQILAISVSFCSAEAIFTGKAKKSLCLCLLACFIHTSAIIPSFLYFIIYFLLRNRNWREERRIVMLSIPLFTIIYIFFLNIVSSILPLLGTTGKFASYYTNYLLSTGRQEFSLTDLAISSMCIGYIWFAYHNHFFSHKAVCIFTFLQLANILFIMLGLYNVWFSRVSYYFSVSAIYIIPIIASHKRIKASSTNLLNGMALLISLFYWIWIFVIRGSQETVPYLFAN